MADIVEADNGDNNTTEMKKEAIVLRTQVQSLDKKLEDLKNLNININSGQEDLWARLDALLSNFCGMGGSTDDEVEVGEEVEGSEFRGIS
ncbi:hypothetical protein TIFTF001_012570 [Ficus carica]|uniref:Uncharacterized protein n=1 Tax=Ficus carica TaxID=3494 RepID=A0AA88A2K3_FICCA|nr:hypothetical protein TIFTF001_012570 [Ficus carica]